MTRLFALFALAAVTAASAAAAGGGPSPGISVGWKGVRDPAKPVRYVAMMSNSDTVVAEIAVRDGTVKRFTTVRGQLGIPFVAFDGSTAGLTPDKKSLILASPVAGPRSTSRIAFFDLKRFRIQDEVSLRGAFSYDAISPSGRLLYLIEHLGGQRDATRYRVRAYDLRRDRLLDAAVRDKRNAHTTMRGMPYTRVTSPNGVWVYTLYGGAEHAFVHSLNTERKQAICIGLPWSGKAQQLGQLRLAVRGSTLLLRRGGRVAATIDTRRFEVVSAARLR
jgi:hypothetical protein